STKSRWPGREGIPRGGSGTPATRRQNGSGSRRRYSRKRAIRPLSAEAMDRQKGQQIRGRTPFQLGCTAARSGASGDAVLARPGLVLGLAHRLSGGHDEVAAVVLDVVPAARPVLGVLDVEHRAERFPSMMGAAIDLDLDALVAGSAHALGIL